MSWFMNMCSGKQGTFCDQNANLSEEDVIHIAS
jgi:hypothetical protein